MKRIYMYCEGPTEESFVNNILAPYFLSQDIFAVPIICTTKRKGNTKYSGGVSSFEKIKKELIRLCKSHPNEMVTTMLDYYGIPKDTPCLSAPCDNIFIKIQKIERAIEDEIGCVNLKANLILHEFEGLLFSEPKAFEAIGIGEMTISKLQEISDSFKSPEEINSSPKTAPSKRILAEIPTYKKVASGTIISKRIGIDRMRAECKHFDQWIDRLSAI